MDALQPRHYNRSEHGLVFNAIAYTCGGVYALGQLTFQGIGKVFVAGWDTGYELGTNSFSGLNELRKGIVFAAHHVFCVAQMVWGIVSPIFQEVRDYTYTFFLEVWKLLRGLPEQVLLLINVPGSVIGGLIRQLCSDSVAGVMQLGVLAKFVVEVIRQVRDFGTIGAFIKDCIQLLGSGLNEIGKAFVAAWKETEIPRHLLIDVFKDLFDCLIIGFGEVGKAVSLVGHEMYKLIKVSIKLIIEILSGAAHLCFDGLYQVYKAGDSSVREMYRLLMMVYDFLGMWLKEFGGYAYSGICEIVKLYEATREDLGNSWQNFIVKPITPYAKQVYDKICEVLTEIEKVVGEVQVAIFGT